MINSIKKDIFFIYQMISDAMQLLSVMHRVCTLCVWKSNKFIENRKKYFRESSAITKEIWDKCKRVKNAKMLITIEKTIDSLKCKNIQPVNLKYTVKTKYCYLHQNTSSFHSVTILKVRELWSFSIYSPHIVTCLQRKTVIILVMLHL